MYSSSNIIDPDDILYAVFSDESDIIAVENKSPDFYSFITEIFNSEKHTIKVEYLETAIGDNAPAANASKSYTLTLDYGQAA